MCPSTDEWISQMQYLLMMEYYSALKMEENSDTSHNRGEPQGHYAN